MPQFLFEGHRLDVERRELRRGSERVMLEPQVFDLIAYLVKNRDRVLTKDDLIAAVWDGRIVSESTLTSRINSARKAVGDTGGEQRLIRTYARKGFRFVGEVQEATESLSAEPDSARRVAAALAKSRGKPCVAVLPFDNLSSDPEQEYFSDGVTEDIITALSKHRSFLVVARNSTFALKGHGGDVRRIGRDLGATTLSRAASAGSGRASASRRNWWRRKADSRSGQNSTTVSSRIYLRYRTRSQQQLLRESNLRSGLPNGPWRKGSLRKHSMRGTSFVSAPNISTNRRPAITAKHSGSFVVPSISTHHWLRRTDFSHIRSFSA